MKLPGLLIAAACGLASAAQAGSLDFNFTSPLTLSPYATGTEVINEGTNFSFSGNLSYRPSDLGSGPGWLANENTQLNLNGRVFNNNVNLGSNGFNFFAADEGMNTFRVTGSGVEYVPYQQVFTYEVQRVREDIYCSWEINFFGWACLEWKTTYETYTTIESEYLSATRDQPLGVNSAVLNVEVRNVAPTITSFGTNWQDYFTGDAVGFAATATDPGITDVLVYNWDLDNDLQFDDFTGAAGSWRYTTPGTYTVGLQVSDGDGGFAYRNSSINVADVMVIDIPNPPPPVPPPTSNVPEPTSIALLGLALAGLGVSRRMKQPIRV